MLPCGGCFYTSGPIRLTVPCAQNEMTAASRRAAWKELFPQNGEWRATRGEKFDVGLEMVLNAGIALRPQKIPYIIARLKVSPNARRKDFGRVRLPSRGNGRSGRAAKNVHEHRFVRKHTAVWPRRNRFYVRAGQAMLSARYCHCIGGTGNRPVPFTLFQSIVGEPESGIVHGGGVSALLEHTAIIKSWSRGECTRFPKMVNLLIEYLRPFFATQDTYAAGTLFKQGRSLISVRVEASQGDSC